MLPVESAFKVYTDLNGNPLDNGYVYFGLPNQNPITAPVTVYWDAAGTQPAAQPLRTVNGYITRAGTPANVYIGTSYSEIVKDSAGRQVFYARTSDDFSIATVVLNFITNLASSIGSSLVGFIQAGIGAVLRTIQDRLRDTVSVKDFGVIGDGSDEYANIKKAWDYCVSNGKNLHFPGGFTYSSGANNMPFKHSDYPAANLLDCRNITISGDGPDTVLHSDSVNGADVVNVYSCKNIHFRNFSVTANLSGSAGSGSNGVSVVGGFDNVTFDGIWCNDLPYVDKGTYLDGGKALTIQPGTPATECGTLKATRIYAKGCVHGAGLEVSLSNWATKKHAIDIDIIAEDCYQGVVFSGAEATSALSANMTSGYSVRAKLINCQRNVIAVRVHGVKIDAAIITTKSAATRRLNPSGGAWAIDTTIDALLCTYGKNSQISITGDIGGCDYKVQIGGIQAGASGLTGTTEKCDFFFDIGGTAATSDFNLVDSGGNTMSNCRLYAAASTFASIPNAAYAPALNNVLTLGPSPRLMGITTAGQLWFAGSDGISVFQKIMVGNSGLRLDFLSTGSSSASNINYGFLKHDGTLLAGFRNDGTFVIQGRNTAASVATVKQVIPIYDNTNTLVGYVPIYTSFA